MATPSNTSTGREEVSEGQTTTTQNHAATAVRQLRFAYTMREAAEELRCSYIQVHRLLKRGKLRASNLMRNKIIPGTELQRAMNESIEE